MQSIVDAKDCVVPGLGNSGKRCDSNCKKSANWGGKRVRSTKAAVEHWIHEDAVECPAMIIKEAVLKCEFKVKDDLKEEVKDEKKEPSKSEKVIVFPKVIDFEKSVKSSIK